MLSHPLLAGRLQAMQLSVENRAGTTFQISASPLDDVAALLAAAAKRARLKPHLVRLSHNGRLLEQRDSVQALGLNDGDRLVLHVRTGHQPSAARSRSTVAHMYSADGLFVNVVTSDGRDLFRPKIRPTDDAAKLIGHCEA